VVVNDHPWKVLVFKPGSTSPQLIPGARIQYQEGIRSGPDGLVQDVQAVDLIGQKSVWVGARAYQARRGIFSKFSKQNCHRNTGPDGIAVWFLMGKQGESVRRFQEFSENGKIGRHQDFRG